MTTHLLAVLAASSLAVSTTALFGATTVTSSDQIEAPRIIELDGHWDGGMTVPAGLTIRFTLNISGNEGTFAAPDQGASGIPLRVSRSDAQVVVTVEKAGAVFEGTLSANGSVLEGIWRQGARAFPAKFMRGKAAEQMRAQTPAAPYPYASRDVAIDGGAPDVRLAATLFSPSAGRQVPAVLLLGGNGPHDRDETYAGHKPMLVLADRLARAGIATLRFDKRGAARSTGNYARASGADFASDAEAAFRWLVAQPEVDPRRSCILGLSEGAMLAPLVGLKTNPACLVLLSSPGLPGPALIGEQAVLTALDRGAGEADARKEGELVRSLLQARIEGGKEPELTALAQQYGLADTAAAALAREMMSPEIGTFLNTDPALALARTKVPVLALAGGNDRQVPPAANLPPIEAALATNSDAQVILVPGLNHMLQPAPTGAVGEYATIETTLDPGVLSMIENFLATTLKVDRPVSAEEGRAEPPPAPAETDG